MAKSMTKAQIVDALAKKTDLTKKAVAEVLEQLAALAYKEAKNGFTVPGLGKLVVVKRKARKGRNPATPEVPHRQGGKGRHPRTREESRPEEGR